VEELLFSFGDVHNVSEARQVEVHTTGSLAHGPSNLEVEITIAELYI
jgi:hypothetical protein